MAEELYGNPVYPKLAYAISEGGGSGFTLSTGLYYTEDIPQKNFSPIGKELTELLTF